MNLSKHHEHGIARLIHISYKMDFKEAQVSLLYMLKVKVQYILIFCLYVDDLIYNGTNQKMVVAFNIVVTKECEMTDLDFLKYLC